MLRVTVAVIIAGGGLALIGYGAWLIYWDVRDWLKVRRIS